MQTHRDLTPATLQINTLAERTDRIAGARTPGSALAREQQRRLAALVGLKNDFHTGFHAGIGHVGRSGKGDPAVQRRSVVSRLEGVAIYAVVVVDHALIDPSRNVQVGLGQRCLGKTECHDADGNFLGGTDTVFHSILLRVFALAVNLAVHVLPLASLH